MKIAFVNTSRGWGGAEEQMLAMAVELGRRGHAVPIVARDGGAVQQRFGREGFRVLPVPRKGWRGVAAPFRVLAYGRERFDVVHAHRDHDLLLGKVLAAACGAPLVLTQHCLPGRPSRLLYGLASRVVAVSEYVAEGVAAKVPSLRPSLRVIVNGIDLARFAEPDRNYWRRHPGVGARVPVLGVIGPFYKGQEELVAMLPRLRRSFPGIVLVLVGEDGERRGAVEAAAARLGVADSVVFAGRIPGEAMKDALGALDLNVSAFRREGFGLTVVEGFAVGTPFAGYRAGGYPEIVTDERVGLLADDPPGLEKAIATMLGDTERTSHHRREACRQAAERFGLGKMVDAYEAVYRELSRNG